MAEYGITPKQAANQEAVKKFVTDPFGMVSAPAAQQARKKAYEAEVSDLQKKGWSPEDITKQTWANHRTYLSSQETPAPFDLEVQMPQVNIGKGGAITNPMQAPLTAAGLDAESFANMGKPVSLLRTPVGGATPIAAPVEAAPQEKVVQDGTIPTKGMSTRIGGQNFAGKGYDTPTEFGISQNVGRPNEKALSPDAKGNYDWDKIRGIDNITLRASAMNLTPEKQAEVDKAKLQNEYDTLSKKYGVDAGYMRGLEKRLGIGDQMTEAQKAANALERDKMKQTLDIAEADRTAKEEDKVMQIALALSPTFKTKDVNDLEEKVTETKDLSLYEAMLKDGTVKGKAGERLAKAIEMVKSKQRKVLKPGDVVDGLRYKGGDPKKEGNWEKE